MMSLNELFAKLQSSGYPVAYRAWPENDAPSMPFICYLCDGFDNLYADAGVYHQVTHVRVELYTPLKDPAAEANVEAALAGFHWKKTETYISTEQCYMILYEIEV